MANVSRVRSAADLEIKYLEAIGQQEKNVESAMIGLTKLENETKNFVKQTVKTLDNIESQLDGNITVWFYGGVPTLSNKPASDWESIETKNEHIGDLYYNKDTGDCYRFRANIDNEVFEWIKIEDSDLREALSIANSYNAASNNNIRIFVNEPKPPYNAGDIWIANGKYIYRCTIGRTEDDAFNQSDWVNETDYSDEELAKKSVAMLNAYKTIFNTERVTNAALVIDSDSITAQIKGVQVQVDQKNKVFTENPIPPYQIGDLWVDYGNVRKCINNKEEGEEFEPSDWELDLNLAEYTTLTAFNMKIGEIESKITDAVDLTVSNYSETGTVLLNNVMECDLLNLIVHPNGENLITLYPLDKLYPEPILYPTDNLKLRIYNTTTEELIWDYELDDELLYLNENVYDSFIYDYETQNCYIIKKCAFNDDDEVIEIEPYEIPIEYPKIHLTEGNYIMSVIGYDSYIYAKAIVKNGFNSQMATKAELSTQIRQTNREIEILAEKKVGNDSIIASINTSPEEIKINANKITLSGETIVDGKLVGKSEVGVMNPDSTKVSALFVTNGKTPEEIDDEGRGIYNLQFPQRVVLLSKGNDNNLGTIVLDVSDSLNLYNNHASITLNQISNGTEKVLVLSPDTIYTDGNLMVGGSKNRVVKIDDDSMVTLNAYETATPYFGDIGSNITDENGECTIDIENIFSQTIEKDDYKVFIQECGNGKVYVEKHDTFFIVKGTPNLEFDWEIKAVQKGYANKRLEKFEI